MRHLAAPEYWDTYHRLPSPVRDLADKQFALLKRDPRHPSLHFKRVGDFWSVRVGRRHRALGVESPEGIVWFWIGTHSEYERFIK